jgi:hypothetical protein
MGGNPYNQANEQTTICEFPRLAPTLANADAKTTCVRVADSALTSARGR